MYAMQKGTVAVKGTPQKSAPRVASTLRVLKENKQKLKMIIDYTTREGANKIDRFVSFRLLKFD